MKSKRKRDAKNKQVNAVTMRRTAREAKKSKMLIRGLMLIALVIVVFLALFYVVSYFWERLGSFTIKVDKYDMSRQGITLSESSDVTKQTSRLNAKIIEDMYNISGEDLPGDLDSYEGSHNGDNYIAYSFYLANSGVDTVSIGYSIDMMNITKNIDAAVRIRVYEDGQYTDYAKPKKNGEPEADTKAFPGSSVAVSEVIEKFSPGDKKKFTVVIWLEGNDPDCVNSVIGGSMKLEMNFKIIETS